MANYVTGKVARVYTDRGGTYIRLEGLASNVSPRDGYFLLQTTHPNYNSLYSLLLTAATNRLDLQIRTVDEISPGLHAVVAYMVVDW